MELQRSLTSPCRPDVPCAMCAVLVLLCADLWRFMLQYSFGRRALSEENCEGLVLTSEPSMQTDESDMSAPLQHCKIGSEKKTPGLKSLNAIKIIKLALPLAP